jgi:methyl-accepting chemotaxis protein
VKELQENSQNAVEIMKKISLIARKQEESVTFTEEKFKGIAEAIDQAEDIIDSLNESSKKMEDEKKEMLRIFSTLSAIARKNVVAGQQIGATAQELTVAIERISMESANLAVMSKGLKTEIDKFAIDSTGGQGRY